MLPWIFVVLLALNLALFLWGYRNEHLREPPLPPVPAGQFEIRLLSEVERAPSAAAGTDQPRAESQTERGAPGARDAPTRAATGATTEGQAPADDLFEPAGSSEDAWVERALTGDAATGEPASLTPPAGSEPPIDPEPREQWAPAGPESAPVIDLDSTDDPAPEPLVPPTPNELPEPTPRDIPPFPELPIQQPRIPGGVSASIESTV